MQTTSAISAIDRLSQSRANYIACFVGDFGVAVVFLTLGLLAGTTLAAVGGFVAGWAIYTFLEWLVHNLLYHRTKWRAQELHLLHHRHPTLPLALPFFATPMLALILAATIPGATSNAVVAGILSGMWWGFFYYGCFHHLGHVRRFRGRPFGRLWTHHLLHHGFGTCNFGVTTTFWDRVFGTYRPGRSRSR